MRGDVLLVGSIPGNSVADAMSSCSSGIGEHLNCLPDGETGKRRIWINFLAATVYDQNPNIETLNSPVPVEPAHPQEWRAPGEDWAPRGYEDHWQFKIRDPEQPVVFPSLGYAEAAAESYKTFVAMRESGEIAAGVRFMVAIPLVESAVRIFFSNGEDYPAIRKAYQQALVSEVGELLKVIPAEDLAIQWDVCMEILAVELNDEQPGLFPWKGPGDPFERFMQSLTHACALVPEQALLGCHLCYGDLGHKHVIEPKDLSVVVDFANEAREKITRTIDFFHMPVPKDRADEAYFKPLAGLDVGDGKLFLGLIHHTDGLDGAKIRIDQANRFIQQYGVATECGFGRRPEEQIPELLEIHQKAVAYLSE